MKPRHTVRLVMGVVSIAFGLANAAGAQEAPYVVPVPGVEGPIRVTDVTHPFGAAEATQTPIDLEAYGYVEEEFFVSGTGSVYDWMEDGSLQVRHSGLGYTTRILVRRPEVPERFSGTVLVDIGNRGAGFDTFATWGQLNRHLLENGHAYVALTVFGGNLGALKVFDADRYEPLAYPSPAETCGGPGRPDNWARPREFFPPVEDGIRWDVISQAGALVRTDAPGSPLEGYTVRRIVASMQSGGDLPTYVTAIAPRVRLADGRPVYDAFLIKDSGGPGVLNACANASAPGDPRRRIHDVGVPVIQILSENSVSAGTRRPDSDTPGDQFRRYELPGASHFDSFQYMYYPTFEDLERAGIPPLSDYWTFPSVCEPHHVSMNDFPQPYFFAGAFRNLERWLIDGTPPPRAAVIELDEAGNARVDAFGNAQGGIRSPWVDVPAARFQPTMEGPNRPFRCDDNGYWVPFAWSRLQDIYGSFESYETRFMDAVDRMVAERWVTEEDGERIRNEFYDRYSGGEGEHRRLR